MRRLGIDHGERRVGIAISDEDGRIAHPRDTLVREDPVALRAAIVALAREEGVAELVVGLPLSLSGDEGTSARRARRFAELLGAESGLPVVLFDERMSSVAAGRALDDVGVRGKARRAVVDRVAAALILQGYLDMARARAERASSNEEEDAWRSDAPLGDAGTPRGAPAKGARSGRSRRRS